MRPESNSEWEEMGNGGNDENWAGLVTDALERLGIPKAKDGNESLGAVDSNHPIPFGGPFSPSDSSVVAKPEIGSWCSDSYAPVGTSIAVTYRHFQTKSVLTRSAVSTEGSNVTQIGERKGRSILHGAIVEIGNGESEPSAYAQKAKGSIPEVRERPNSRVSHARNDLAV